ncbi:unnamed protein product [Tuber aestivum]|uniref:Uncharacterized protein n=1 Tax=Tuber aestivum TaxID=59557 RepID=A0A292Q362_9PEZI|nr:unnamed protein product [Tuber aestivum]
MPGPSPCLYTRDLVGPAATVICGAFLFAMDILIRSDIQQTQTKVDSIYIDLTIAKADIKDVKTELTTMKSELTTVKSDIMGIQTNVTNTRNDLLNQIRYARHVAGSSPLAFISPDRKKSGADEKDS